MKRGGWPRPPLILALILGNILENTFQISNRAHDGLNWLMRPIVLIILTLIVITLFFAVKGALKKKLKQSEEKDSPAAGEGSEKNPVISLPFTAVLAVLFIWAGFESQPWPREVKQFPLAISIPASILVLFTLFFDWRDLMKARREAGGWVEVIRTNSEQAMLFRSLTFFGYLLAMIVLTYPLGQKVALPIFIGMYLWRWGGYDRRLSIGYAVGGWIFIIVFYDRIMNLLFHPSWLYSWLQPLFPEWLPSWLLF